MVPEISLPTSTWFVGCSLPVADTVTTRFPRATVLGPVLRPLRLAVRRQKSVADGQEPDENGAGDPAAVPPELETRRISPSRGCG